MKVYKAQIDCPRPAPGWTFADELICKVATWVAVLMEEFSFRLKRMMLRRAFYKFTHKFSLMDARQGKVDHDHYNPYQGVNLLVIDKLISSGEINVHDTIMDVGSGAGLFLIYLAARGFRNLVGVEYNSDVYEVCMKNIATFAPNDRCPKASFRIYNGNALEIPIDDDVTVFYLFNPFYDKATYAQWLKQVRVSIEKCPRRIKILLLYPTVASEGAIRNCDWLQEKRRISCERQTWHKIVFFIVFESVSAPLV